MIKNLKIIIAFVVGIFLLIAVVLGYFGLSDFDKKKAKYDIASKNASIIKDDLFKQKISSKEHQKDMELSLNEIFKVDQSSNNDNNKEKRVIKPYDLSTLPPEPDAELVKTEFVDVNNNKVRDDIEIAVAEAFEDDADLVEAYFAQARVSEHQLYLSRNKMFDKKSLKKHVNDIDYAMECNNLFYKDIYAKELKYNYFDMAILLVTSKVFNTDKKKKLRENLSYWSSNIDGYKIYPTYSECKNFFESTKKLSINQEVKDKTQILNQNNSKELGHKNQKVNKKKKEKREIKPYDLSTLPPEPDAELVKTEFVDVNGNKVRDDIEIAVAKKFQRDADLVEAYFADSRTLEYELYLARNKIFDKGSIEQSLKNMHYTMDCNYLLYEDVYEKELEWDAFEMSRILLGPRVYNTDEKEKLIDDFYRMQDGYVHTDEPTYSECKEFFESTKDLLVKKEKRAIKPYDLSKLPPKPDSKLVKTKFVDVNKNKIRDDIEIFIAKKFQEDADLVESFFARTRVLEHQLYLARNKMLDKKNIRKDTERITYATRCNYLLYEDLYDDKLAWDVSRLFEDSVFYKIFNTDEKRNLKDEFSFAYDDFSDDFTEVWFTPTYSRCKEFFESTKNLPVGG